MKVLITGADGFIGSHLVDSQLEKGWPVRAVDLHATRLAQSAIAAGHPSLEMVTGDITASGFVQEIVEGVDVVYHLASAHLDVSLSDEHYRRVNIGATRALVEAARHAGVKRFVHCSSVGVIGDVDHLPADEESACRPTNIYERTKLAGEQAVLELAHQNGLPLVVARPAWVYGPRCPRTAKLFRAIAKGRFAIFGKGDNYRHPVYVSDAVAGLELCAQNERACGEVYILAGSQPVRVSELIDLISQEFGVRPTKLRLPYPLGWSGGLGIELAYRLIGKQPPFSRRSLDFFRKHNAYSIEKARHQLGYQPRVDLRTGIRNTIRSMNLAS